MSRIKLQSKPLRVPPLIKLGTLNAMAMVARKIAISRKAIEAIGDVESDLLKKGKEDGQVFKQKMMWIASVSRGASANAAEAVMILKGMKGDVEGYLREFRAIRKSPEWREL